MGAKVTVLLCPHTHIPEGKEKYVLGLHECDSSTSLSMAFTAAPAPKCSLVSHNVAQQGEDLSYHDAGLGVPLLPYAQFLFCYQI